MGAPTMTTTEGALTLGDTVRTVYDRAAYFAFRAANVFRAVATEQRSREQLPMPGNIVTFTKIGALAVQTSALSETADPSHLSLATAQVPVTLVEQGATAKATKKLRLTSFLDVDMVVPREVSANMEESLDIIARNILDAATNVLYAGGSAGRTSIAATENMTGNDARRMRAELMGRKTPPPAGSLEYVGFIHPDVSYDFQAESGQQAWTAPHVYVDTENIYSGEIGRFAGIRWVENANSRIFVDAGDGLGGAGLIDVYDTIVVGLQALGEGIGESQHMVITGPFDDLGRFVSVGWYYLGGFGIIRQESVQRFEAASSIGDNT